MPRIRSLVTPIELDVVVRAHDCQGNSAHRLTKGERRLAVKKERGWDYYCLACAKLILERDAVRIAGVLRAIDTGDLMAASGNSEHAD